MLPEKRSYRRLSCTRNAEEPFDGGRLTSDVGVLLLAEIDRRLGVCERLARCIEDPRAPERVQHTLAEMIRFRALLIAAGYPDANDCDALRSDPAFKMAVGRLPESGGDLCSQPTLENLPSPVALKRMMAAMVDLFCDSFATVPRRIVLDIDDTEDRVHGAQQLSLFHAYYDGRCFLPMHIIARIEASAQGTDTRFIVTNLTGTPKALYETIYCARGADGEPHQGPQAAPRFRSDLLQQGDGEPVPVAHPHRRLLAAAHLAQLGAEGVVPQFDTLRLGLIKVAARVTEMVTRVKVSLPSSFSYQESLTGLAARTVKLPP